MQHRYIIFKVLNSDYRVIAKKLKKKKQQLIALKIVDNTNI